MKVLVTGASGNFAPYLIRELRDAGHEVSLFSRKKPSDEFSEMEWICADLLSAEDCINALKGRGFDAIQHTAAKPGPTDTLGSKGYDDPAVFPLTMQTNIIGTYNLLQSCVRNNVGIFVMTGSNCALGHGFRISDRPFDVQYLPIDEEHPCDPEDSYSFSKWVNEQQLKQFSNTYGIRTYSLRSAGITDHDRRVQMAENAAPMDGWSEWMYNWIASEDIAVAHRLLMEKAETLPLHDVYFCNNDDSQLLEPTMDLITTYRPDLVDCVRKLDGYDALFTSQKLKDAVGWKPVKSWRKYLKEA